MKTQALESSEKVNRTNPYCILVGSYEVKIINIIYERATEMKYPKLLEKGNTIGICAPSSGVTEPLFNRLDKAIQNVELLGYKCSEATSVRQNIKCVSAKNTIRVKEFMNLYENPDVAVILPPWGGEFLMELLPLLDFEYISQIPPKWICGYFAKPRILNKQ